MKFIKIATLASLTLPAIFSYSSYAADELAKHLYTAEAPKPKVRVHPKYPRAAAKQSREGWAVLNFVIDEQGKVSNVLVDDSSGSVDIEKAAVKAVQKWRYTPAMENGKPVKQCANSVLFNFNINEHGEKGISSKFRSLYMKAKKAMQEQDFPALEKYLARMEKNKYQHLSENTYYNMLAADYAKLKGDKTRQVRHLQTVVWSLDNLAHEKQKLSVLYQVFDLQIQLKRYNSAFRTYKKLKKLPAAKPYLAELKKTVRQIDAIIDGDNDISYQATLKDKGYWLVHLARKKFSLTDVSGELSKLELRCANKHHVYEPKADNTWAIPASWNKCRLYVFGEQGSSFKVSEHPLSS